MVQETKATRVTACDGCGTPFKTRSKLLEHYRICSYDYPGDLDDELLDESPDDNCDGFYLCPHPRCNLMWAYKSDLRNHCDKTHPSCSKCMRSLKSLLQGNTVGAHSDNTIPCPGSKCARSFDTGAALLMHLESGACSSRMTREHINRIAVQYDTERLITSPSRLVCGPDGYAPPDAGVTMIATERSWNGESYECFLCHREFLTLYRLNQHLASPSHAAKMYNCPGGVWQGCSHEFKTLSGLCQHVEGEVCGIRRFNQPVQEAIEALAGGLRGLTFR